MKLLKLNYSYKYSVGFGKDIKIENISITYIIGTQKSKMKVWNLITAISIK